MTNHKLPDQIERFKEQVLAAEAGATFMVDTPAAETGFWWIDVDSADGLAICCWSQERGFGLYTDNDDDFGERPNELHRDPAMAAARLLQIARDLKAGQSASLTLARLRELHGLSQTELAEKLGVGQAAISKLESRSEAQVGTLARAVRELGGELVLTVRFPTFDAEFGLPEFEPRVRSAKVRPAKSFEDLTLEELDSQLAKLKREQLRLRFQSANASQGVPPVKVRRVASKKRVLGSVTLPKVAARPPRRP